MEFPTMDLYHLRVGADEADLLSAGGGHPHTVP